METVDNVAACGPSNGYRRRATDYEPKVGWRRRGALRIYTARAQGSQMKSTYVGRGGIAQLILQFQGSSNAVERIVRSRRF